MATLGPSFEALVFGRKIAGAGVVEVEAPLQSSAGGPISEQAGRELGPVSGIAGSRHLRSDHDELRANGGSKLGTESNLMVLRPGSEALKHERQNGEHA